MPIPPKTVFVINNEKALKAKTKINPISVGIKKPIKTPEIIASRDELSFEPFRYLIRFSINITPKTEKIIFKRA